MDGGSWIRRFEPLEVKDFSENWWNLLGTPQAARLGLWKQHRLSQKVPVSAWNNSMGTVFEIIYSKFVEHGTFIYIYLILYKFGIIWWFKIHSLILSDANDLILMSQTWKPEIHPSHMTQRGWKFGCRAWRYSSFAHLGSCLLPLSFFSNFDVFCLPYPLVN